MTVTEMPVAERPGEERFTAADLLPSEDELRARRLAVIDRAAATVAVVCAGALVGGLVALGFCAAPMVFKLPRALAGNVMGAAFARWDRVAMGAAALLLVCEIVRARVAGSRRRKPVVMVRRITAVLVALCTAYIGAFLSPRILGMHHEGVTRGEGEQGAELEATHKRAELVGKVEAALALALVGLHVFTLRGRGEDDDEDDDDAPAPLPPGPRP